MSSVSLKPQHFEAGGIDDFVGRVTLSRFVMFDYDGKASPVPALRWEIDAEGYGVITQHWSAGRATDWQVTEDGRGLIPLGRARGLNQSSNAALLIASLVNAGFPEELIGDDASVFEGVVARFRRQTLKRSISGKDREDSVLLVAELVEYEGQPGSQAAPQPAPQATVASRKAPAKKAQATQNDQLRQQVTEVILQALAEGPVEKRRLPSIIMGSDLEDRQGAIKLVFDEDYLRGGPWTYEGGVLSL